MANKSKNSLGVSLIGAALLTLNLAAPAALGAGDGTYQATPEKFVLMFHKIGVCSSLACPSPVVLATQTAPYDIAAVAPGAAAGTFAASASLPPGSYSHVHIVIGRDIVYRGRIAMTSDGQSFDCVTNGSQQDPERGVIDGTAVEPGTGSTRDIIAKFAPMFAVGTEFSEAGSRFKLLSDTQIEAVFPLASPIVVAAGQQMPKIRISIDAAGALWGGVNQTQVGQPPACYLYGEAPTINVRTE
jgi:hypothetical protein